MAGGLAVKYILALVVLACPVLAHAQSRGGIVLSHPGGDLDSFLHQGIQKSPPMRSGVYRARSYEWHLTSGESRGSLISHLSTPQREHHGAYFDRGWLSTLTYNELVGVHSDAHNNRVQWQYVGRVSAAPVVSVQRTYTYSSNCPGGICPTGRPTRSERRFFRRLFD